MLSLKGRDKNGFENLKYNLWLGSASKSLSCLAESYQLL